MGPEGDRQDVVVSTPRRRPKSRTGSYTSSGRPPRNACPNASSSRCSRQGAPGRGTEARASRRSTRKRRIAFLSASAPKRVGTLERSKRAQPMALASWLSLPKRDRWSWRHPGCQCPGRGRQASLVASLRRSRLHRRSPTLCLVRTSLLMPLLGRRSNPRTTRQDRFGCRRPPSAMSAATLAYATGSWPSLCRPSARGQGTNGSGPEWRRPAG